MPLLLPQCAIDMSDNIMYFEFVPWKLRALPWRDENI